MMHSSAAFLLHLKSMIKKKKLHIIRENKISENIGNVFPDSKQAVTSFSVLFSDGCYFLLGHPRVKTLHIISNA